MKRIKYDIFISCRYDGGVQYARTLQLILEMKGYRVFWTYDELVDEKFSPQMEAAIKNSTIYLIILTKGSMGRCANEGDRVRREIETVLEAGKLIVAVNPDGTFDGIPNTVPQRIKSTIENTQHFEVNFDKTLQDTVDLMVENCIRPHIDQTSWRSSARRPISDFDSSPDYGAISHRPCPPPPPRESKQTQPRETYGIVETAAPEAKRSLWSRMFGKKAKSEYINASAYAPAEVVPHKHFIVRIFFHRPEDSNTVDLSVKDVDKKAVKKANKSLNIPIKDGDEITVQLSMSEGIHIDEPIQNSIWRGRYIESDFVCELIKENIHSISGKAIVAINNVPAGDLKFTIDVVTADSPKVYASVEPRRYTKIFISYAHADYSQVRGIAEGCKINGSDYFFDRHTLKAGDIFKDKILQYIDNADLFVLCWSKNAAESEWVQIERKRALELMEKENPQLEIYPLSLKPEAPLPEDMSDKYNFASL